MLIQNISMYTKIVLKLLDKICKWPVLKNMGDTENLYCTPMNVTYLDLKHKHNVNT